MLDKIKKNLSSMTGSHQKIGKYLLAHHHLAASLSAEEFAKEVGVSNATIVRFAQSLGFSGFTEMKNHIKQTMRGTPPYMHYVPAAKNEGETQQNQIFSLGKTDLNRLEELLLTFDENKIEEAVQAVYHADKIYFMALGTAVILQEFLSIHLHHMGFPVVEPSRCNEPNFEKLADITKKDLLIAISFPRYSLKTCKAAQFAKEQGACILGITDTENSPIAASANIALTAPTTSTKSFFNSYIPPMGLCNILLMKIFFQNSGQLEKNIKNHMAKLNYLSSL